MEYVVDGAALPAASLQVGRSWDDQPVPGRIVGFAAERPVPLPDGRCSYRGVAVPWDALDGLLDEAPAHGLHVVVAPSYHRFGRREMYRVVGPIQKSPIPDAPAQTI